MLSKQRGLDLFPGRLHRESVSATMVRMNKWEYLQVMMTTRPVKEGHSRLIILGKSEPERAAPGTRLIDLLGRLGEEGWELTGVVDMSSVDETKGAHDIHLTSSSFIFKRPAGNQDSI